VTIINCLQQLTLIDKEIDWEIFKPRFFDSSTELPIGGVQLCGRWFYHIYFISIVIDKVAWATNIAMRNGHVVKYTDAHTILTTFSISKGWEDFSTTLTFPLLILTFFRKLNQLLRTGRGKGARCLVSSI